MRGSARDVASSLTIINTTNQTEPPSSPGVRRPSDSGQGSRLPGARRLGGAALRPAVGFSV